MQSAAHLRRWYLHAAQACAAAAVRRCAAEEGEAVILLLLVIKMWLDCMSNDFIVCVVCEKSAGAAPAAAEMGRGEWLFCLRLLIELRLYFFCVPLLYFLVIRSQL